MEPASDTFDKNLKEEIETNNDNSFNFGRVLASPAPGEEVVITGLAGAFPSSENVHEFRDNLFNKVDMVTPTTRWPSGDVNIPKRSGQMKDISKFDNAYFGVNHRSANVMDPMIRLLLEKVIEALFDAGINPKDLEGTNTGVFVGSCYSESEVGCVKMGDVNDRNILGCTRSMLPNRISYYLKLKGPSYVVDSACSSSLFAFEHAYRSIRLGLCDSAIVGGANLCLHPNVSFQFNSLGVLSDDGACKAFDQGGDGYARSEAICAVYLQKSKDAKRIYAQVVHTKTNCDGYKEKGITFPSGKLQGRLLKECYMECDVDVNELSFMEAHGTGTKVGDPEEANAIANVFCKLRNKPLLIGSLKSNIGHSEPASGLCSIIKSIIAMESGYIPPNLHFTSPRKGVLPLENGSLKVVTEKTLLPKGKVLLGINSFGFGGANCHVLLTNNLKEKVNGGQPRDELPRLICISGRTENAVTLLLDDVLNNMVDTEQIRLLQSVFSKSIDGHLYRGYSIVTKSGEITRSVKRFSIDGASLYFIFSDFGNHWQNLGSQLFSFPIFAASMQRIHNVLETKGISIIDILMNTSDKTIAVKILGNIAVQIGIADILKTLNLIPDGIFGYALGELVCAYFDNALTLEETVNSAYIIANATEKLNDSSSTTSYMIAIQTDQINQIVPKNVEVIAINSENSVIISGDTKVVTQFIGNLKNHGILVTKLDTPVTNFHCEQFRKIKTELVQQLAKVILNPKQLNKTKHYASAEYFVNALTNIASFKEFSKNIKKGSLLLEIGNGQLQPILKESIQVQTKNYHFNGLEGNSLNSLLKTLGGLFEDGLNPQLEKLYPKVQFPVSRGTPMISPHVKWCHEKSWFNYNYKGDKKTEAGEIVFAIDLKDKNLLFFTGHIIDGRNLVPATGYLRFVWEAYARINDSFPDKLSVVFENCKFLRATNVPKEGSVLLTVMVQPGSGKFEVIESGTAIVTGRIYHVADTTNEMVDLPATAIREKDLVLKTKDIYKELRLRGYNYKGLFKGIKGCNITASEGLIKWDGNWVSFMDNMLQMQILQIDSRFLYVPTSIDKITIDAPSHLKFVESFGEQPNIPVYVYPSSKIIKCEAIEIRGLKASSISKRKVLGQPVLEKYEFIPNVATLSTHQSLRVNVGIALENSYSTKVKVVEIVDEATKDDSDLLGPLVFDILGDQPLIQAEIIILSENEMEVSNATVENKLISAETDCNLIVGTNLLGRAQVLQQAFGALKDTGHILSRESLDFTLTTVDLTGLTILTTHTSKEETLVLFCKSTDLKKHAIVDVTSKNIEFDWLPILQDSCKNNKNVIVFSQNETLSGVLGLVNCIRREPEGHNVKCVFIVDEAPPFDPNNAFYVEQLNKNLAINVYKDGKWGTYRHLLLEGLNEVESEHCFVNTMAKGDLSSLTWLEGHLSPKTISPNEKTLVHVYYSAINFRDVMTASGKINADVITMDRLQQECIQGFEFSGRDNKGRRVMGMVTNGALSNLIEADNYLLWPVPDSMTLEEAATLPVVYGTCLYGLVMTVKMKKGDTLLIHSGTGGIGQAAIQLALSYGCTVYTTVGTQEKREFLKKRFPALKDNNIGSSRDLSFVSLVMKETKGLGVDIVLNSLAEEKLLASVGCLARGGKFVEIGKFDMANNNSLNLLLLQKEASFHGIMLDQLFFRDPHHKNCVFDFMMKSIHDDIIKPLNTNIFKTTEIEQAFRFMASGKHMGKVLIEMMKEESEKICLPKVNILKAHPRYFCHEDKTYIITGGLGGFGLELADWLVLRGARKLVLTSRKGVQTGYQALRIKIWKTYGVRVEISTAEIREKSGCMQLIQEAEKIGPIHGIFNLAVVLKDAILENQTQETFNTSFGPKAYATKFLDEVTREHCPVLRDFVIFSSVSCGRGNAGQTNYGMANSVMERICEQRKLDGYPALAVEWGAVGDVGLVADMQEDHLDLEIGGTLQQKISSCLAVLDGLLRQNKTPIVASMVVAEKRNFGYGDNIVESVADILGIRDLKAVGFHTTFPELGMDSMTAVEIKQTLEREFEVFLSSQDIRNMTFARLEEIQADRSLNDGLGTNDNHTAGMNIILRILGDEKTLNEPIIKLASKMQDGVDNILFFPGIEGVATQLQTLANDLNFATLGIQSGCVYEENTIFDLAKAIIPYMSGYISKNKPFKIAAYSFGVMVALEVVSILEAEGYRGQVICVDGAPQLLLGLTKLLDMESEAKFQTSLIYKVLGFQVKIEEINKHKETLYNCKTLEERIKIAQNIAKESVGDLLNGNHIKQIVITIYKRTKNILTYKPSYTKIHSKVSLLKAKHCSVQGLDDDFQLSKICGQKVDVKIFEANHFTILECAEVAECINFTFGNKPIIPKEPETRNIFQIRVEEPKIFI